MSESGSKWSKLAGAVIFADQLLGQIPQTEAAATHHSSLWFQFAKWILGINSFLYSTRL